MASTYPLVQLLEIKEKRADEALKAYLEKKKQHEQEAKKLKQAVEKCQEIERHYREKKSQFYTSLQKGISSEKIRQSKDYLKTAFERLKDEEKKVETQRQLTEQAEQAKWESKKQLDQKRLELEKLELHKKSWQREAKSKQDQLEQLQQDELGILTFGYHTRQKKQ